MDKSNEFGHDMYRWICDLFPLNRSLTGIGVVSTLEYIKAIIPDLTIRYVETGFCACDWIVPDEWSVEEAFIETVDGNRVVDFAINNLHLVGYSEPVDRIVEIDELRRHLHSLPSQPNAIPYVTSYYQRTWGFCVSEYTRQTLKESSYRCVIRSKHFAGRLHYADLVVPGTSKKEIVFSSYVCHPSMANNELSGPALLTAIAQYVQALSNRNYTYRFILAPETIGALVYLEKQGVDWPSNVVGLFNLTCVGDDNAYSFLPSRNGDTYLDKIARFVFRDLQREHHEYTYLTRGSDERQYNSPGVDVPTVSMMRSKYYTFPEYHTSLDNLDFVSPPGLQGSFDVHKHAIHIIETNMIPTSTVRGEPQLGRYGLYEALSIKRVQTPSRDYLNVLAYADGINDLVDICCRIEISYTEVLKICKCLTDVGLLLGRDVVH
jgi:aminopeptidase-like protein